MIVRKYFIILCFPVISILLLTFPGCKNTEEANVSTITGHILSTRNEIASGLFSGEAERARFITFWDFDGTIQKGDCTEGLEENGHQKFKGLAQKAIEDGLSKEYPPASYPRFIEKTILLEKQDHLECLLLYPRALAGTSEADIIAFSEKYFSSTLSRYFFSSSVAVIRKLQQAGIEVYIISASADVFVKGASEALHVPRKRIHGIVMKSDNGRITGELVPPLPHGTGKTTVLKTITAALEKEGPVFILAGFGNSYGTDGDFLSYIASLQLPAGKTIAVMINGGDEPEKYRGLFFRVRQEAVIGGNGL